MDGYQPLRAALALELTGDDKFVDYVLQDHRLVRGEPDPLNSPIALCGMLAHFLFAEHCLVPYDPIVTPDGWVLNELVKFDSCYTGRFKSLASAIKEPGPWRRGDIPKLLLATRLEIALGHILLGIKDGKIAAHAVPIWGETIGRAASLTPDAITDTMVLGTEGHIYQEPPNRAYCVPGFKSIVVNWKHLKKFNASEPRALRLTSPTSEPPIAPRRRGRSKGDGETAADEPLILEMKELIESGLANSANHAAGIVANKSPGHNMKSTQERLGRKFRKRQQQGLPPFDFESN